MNSAYIGTAVLNYIDSLFVAGDITRRPVRIDGFTRDEAEELIDRLGNDLPGIVVWVLGPDSVLGTQIIDSDRATRLRNDIDKGEQDTFLLLRPQGQGVESSLEWPSFLVVQREALFSAMLDRLRQARFLTRGQIDAVKRQARFTQQESIYAFLWAWDEVTNAVEPTAAREHLGLLEDSKLAGDLGQIAARLELNRKAIDLLLDPGVSPRKLVSDLVGALSLDANTFGEEVVALQDWFARGSDGAPPRAIDLGAWDFTTDPGDIEIDLVPDVRQEPHRGWMDRDGFAAINPKEHTATFAWVPKKVPADVRYEVTLVEAKSGEPVAKRIGGTGNKPARKIKWSSVIGTEQRRQRLKELDETGELMGYSLELHVHVLTGTPPRRVIGLEPLQTTAFLSLEAPDAPAEESRPSPTLYHGLYQFHQEQKATAPKVTVEATGDGPRVVFESDNGLAKEASLDLPARLAAMESRILGERNAGGPWSAHVVMGADGLTTLQMEPASRALAEVPESVRDARANLFGLLVPRGSVEFTDVLAPEVKAAIEAYCSAFEKAVEAVRVRCDGGPAPAVADRHRLAAILGLDTVILNVDDGLGDDRILLVSPLHPASLAWLLDFATLIRDWSRTPFDPKSKPLYKGEVEAYAVGPRSMAMRTLEHESLRDWAYGGNLTASWQYFLPAVDQRIRTAWLNPLQRALDMKPGRNGTAQRDARRMGLRVKKYAVFHPYVGQLTLASVSASDGMEMLDALRVVDEPDNTPAGARSIAELKYELTAIGPRSPELGSAIDAMISNPGDAAWAPYSDAVVKNPGSVLSPGFAFARRPIDASPTMPKDYWEAVKAELAEFEHAGLHVVVMGPMLTPKVRTLATAPSSVERGGLSIRPTTTHLGASSSFRGSWVVAAHVPQRDGATPSESCAASLGRALALIDGRTEREASVGLEVSLEGQVASALREAHKVADWVVIADPLFSIELMDRRHTGADQPLMLDFTPEFEPFPSGRIVVTSGHVDALESAASRVLDGCPGVLPLLASISARLALRLSNPTPQVVGELTGLALTRSLIGEKFPGGLVVPVDGHEELFASRLPGASGKLADLLVVCIEDEHLAFHVVESKYSASARLVEELADGAGQARRTRDVIRDQYLRYGGVDAPFRLEALREAILFHIARARRHGVAPTFDEEAIRALFASPETLKAATVDASVVGWWDVAGVGPFVTDELDGARDYEFGRDEIAAYRDRICPSGATAPVPEPKPGPQPEPEPEPTPTTETEPTPTPTPTPTTETELELEPEGVAAGLMQPVRAESVCIRLGKTLAMAKDVSWCPPQLSNGHLILIGGSGSGKTTTLRYIVEQLRSSGVPVLVLDFHGDITPAGGKESLFRFDYAHNEAFINPFHLDTRYPLIPLQLRDEFIEAWRAIYPTLGVHQVNFLVSLIDSAFAAKGITKDPATWGNGINFADVIQQFEASEADPAAREKIRGYMRAYVDSQIFHGGNEVAVERFLDESVRLDLSQLQGSIRTILADVVLRRLFMLVKAMGALEPGTNGWAKFRAYIVIDEAQVLMASQGEIEASLAKYAAEARKFGIGLILATQLKDNVPDAIWGNIDTRLFMQALDRAERVKNARAAGVTEDELASLRQGQAILTISSQPQQAKVRLQVDPPWI